ncbi:AMP-binding protein [Promicromonospora thailandica]|uniref:Acyl-CoA synthetase (AMP-forming)/AMP-acid ligase II n=1 Tax=Promicromonospora thailandica TaxID=765201 RepID=A0A9X2G6W2_9MICO|nr:AMP-binding protein [Promicromonospora thailandica]MCP2264339.1 Acyl-CoA synthetase (AMP-forming)/AMP-acid ligase II [Promicromonospora thailandica]BFF20971.1 AMP-binding protein [Promicromonospora thailandica]
MVVRSQLPDVDVPRVSLHEYLFGDVAPDDLDRVAVVDGVSGATTTFRSLLAQIDTLAGAVAARGFGVGDVVALHAPNVPAYVTVFHGLLRAGITVTTVNALASGPEITKQLADSGARLLVTVSPLLAAGEAGATGAGLSADQVVVLDGAEGYTSLADLLADPHPAPDVSFDPATHLAVLPYSSGTTGRPKGVMLTHTNLVANVEQSLLIGVGRDDVVPCVLPFFHIYGMTVLLNLALRTRARLVTLPRFDLAQYLGVIQEHRATFLFVAPPIALALAKHPLVAEHDTSSVRAVLSGAAPLDEKLAAAVRDRLDVRVLQGYGMTEMSPVSHVIPVDRPDISPGTVGLLVAGMEARIVDPATGTEIQQPAEGVSGAGELLCRGPNVMVGYLGNPQATAETLEPDGFLHTGDIVTVDADGVFRVVDRLKELIKYKGYQVPPAELEALLLSHPGIADAAVIGLPDEEAGEVPKAYVVTAPGATLTARDVMEFVAEQVAPYKKVRAVEFIEAVPKSASGKILRKDLRAAG